MQTRAPSLPLDQLLCPDCGTGVPAYRVDGTTHALCHRCIFTAVLDADRQLTVDEDAIRRRLDEIGR